VNNKSIISNSAVFDESTQKLAKLEGSRYRRELSVSRSASCFSVKMRPDYNKKLTGIENMYKKNAIKLNDAKFKLLINSHSSGSIWKDSGIRLSKSKH
jgi:hypothetical protein